MNRYVLVLIMIFLACPLGWAKKSKAGKTPATQETVRTVAPKVSFFSGERDPFKAPTEVLPTECLPSMPLCRFDYSQLKLVGVIQIGGGQLKGMVEDPDGSGYFLVPGMKVGNGTVTQVTRSGVTIHLHKRKQDVTLPLSYK
jgi:hypothetical protein